MYQTTARISNELNKSIKIAAIKSGIQIQHFIEKIIVDNQKNILQMIYHKDNELLRLLYDKKDIDIGFLLSKNTKDWIGKNHLKTREIVIVAFYIFQKKDA